MRIHIFGDSHAGYLFGRISDASIRVLGPRTMHRVGRDGADFVTANLEGYSAGDPLVFVFGEIDVRCHVAKRDCVIKNGVSDLATRYVDAIASLRESLPSSPLCIVGVVPPLEPARINADFPVVGSAEQRVLARTLLNETLRQLAIDRKLTYVAVPTLYENPNGTLKKHLSDGAAHIAKDCAGAMCLSLSRTLGVNVRIERPRKLAKLHRAMLRHIAALSNNAAQLWTLGIAT